MSRVAKNPITIPDSVDLSINENVVIVKGSKGELDFVLPDTISLDVADKVITIKYDEENQQSVALAGTSRSLINNMVIGVSEGFEKKLELIGVGYRAKASGKLLELTLGFSHPVEHPIPEGVKVTVEENTKITVEGFNKQIVGQFASEVRAYYPPEPYKGKGVRYTDEYVRRKAGKSVAS